MTPFHINTGKIFAQPYESAYAMLRRCLLANPGMPLAALEANLRALRPDLDAVVERLEALQPSPGQVDPSRHARIFSGWQRGCPECARQLYHTELFAYPWLTRCPIHHCALTTRCPVCHQLWPAPTELARRECSGCGIVLPDGLKASIGSAIEQQRYQPIGVIYALLDTPPISPGLCIADRDVAYRYRTPWWLPVPEESPRFPAFSARRQGNFPHAKLRALHLPVYDIRCRSTRLSRIEYPSDPRPAADRETERWQRFSHPTIGYAVTQRIVAWIARYAPSTHQLHVASYRYLRMRDLIHAPPLCSYCFAFSLWFFHCAAVAMAIGAEDAVDDYPFLNESGGFMFLSPIEPQVVIYDDYYKTTDAFSAWFYRRGLELSFLDMLRFAVFFGEQLATYRAGDQTQYRPYARQSSNDFLYLATVSEEQLYFYYENLHPLDVYRPPQRTDLNSTCMESARYHAVHKLDDTPVTLDPIPAGPLANEHYRSLCERFRRSYGSSPMH